MNLIEKAEAKLKEIKPDGAFEHVGVSNETADILYALTKAYKFHTQAIQEIHALSLKDLGLPPRQQMGWRTLTRKLLSIRNLVENVKEKIRWIEEYNGSV